MPRPAAEQAQQLKPTAHHRTHSRYTFTLPLLTTLLLTLYLLLRTTTHYLLLVY